MVVGSNSGLVLVGAYGFGEHFCAGKALVANIRIVDFVLMTRHDSASHLQQCRQTFGDGHIVVRTATRWAVNAKSAGKYRTHEQAHFDRPEAQRHEHVLHRPPLARSCGRQTAIEVRNDGRRRKLPARALPWWQFCAARRERNRFRGPWLLMQNSGRGSVGLPPPCGPRY